MLVMPEREPPPDITLPTLCQLEVRMLDLIEQLKETEAERTRRDTKIREIIRKVLEHSSQIEQLTEQITRLIEADYESMSSL